MCAIQASTSTLWSYDVFNITFENVSKIELIIDRNKASSDSI